MGGERYESEVDVIRIQFGPAYFPRLLHRSAGLLCSAPWGRHEASLGRFAPGAEEVKEEFVLPVAKPNAYAVTPMAAPFPISS